MKKSVFSAAKLAGLTAVNRGTKSSNDIRPAITTARGMNKFTMNASASALIGCGHGDRVVMFAMPNADSINERFFIALSAGSEGCKLASAGNTKGTVVLSRLITLVFGRRCLCRIRMLLP